MTAVQAHIHLDALDVPHDSDGAPAARWRATKRSHIPSVQISVSRSVTGHTYVARVVNSGNTPVVHNDWRFALRVTRMEYDYLISLLGQALEFIDNVHPNVGTSASDYIQNVALRSVSEIENLDPRLNLFEVTIELISMENPS